MALLKKLLILGFIMILTGTAAVSSGQDDLTAAEDEIVLEIRLHTHESIYLIEASFFSGGELFSSGGELFSSGGVCCADMRSPLTGSVDFRLCPADYSTDVDWAKLSVSLSVQTEPVSDDENGFADAHLIPVSSQTFLSAAPGEHCVLILREDQTDGCYLTVLKGTPLSPDGRYSAAAAFENKEFSEKSMVEITIRDTWGLEPDCVFSPVRSLDFWGLYWEGSRLAVDSSDVGTLYYEKDAPGNWTQPQG